MGRSTSVFNKIILETTSKELLNESAVKEFMNIGGWKARRSGRELKDVFVHSQEIKEKNKLIIELYVEKTDWREWIKTVGEVDNINPNSFNINFEGENYNVKVSLEDGVKKI